MTNQITPEAVERLFREIDERREMGFVGYGGEIGRDLFTALAAERDALARELAEVKAELDAARATNLDLHRRTQEAESRAYKKAGRMKRKVNRVWGWYYTAVDIAKADFHRAIKAESDLATARAQIVAAQEDMRERAASLPSAIYDNVVYRDAIRALPLTDPADALAEHDLSLAERAFRAGFGIATICDMTEGAAWQASEIRAAVARGEQEGRDG